VESTTGQQELGLRVVGCLRVSDCNAQVLPPPFPPVILTQGLYVLGLDMGYAAKMIIVDWYNLILWQYEGVPMSSLISSWQLWFTVGMRIFWIAHHIVLPSYLHGFWVSHFKRTKETAGEATVLSILVLHAH